MAEALSIKVLFYDTVSLMPIGNAEAVSSLAVLLPKCDFISVNVSTNLENKNLFGAEQFSLMKKGSFFINSSFGDAADHEALAASIKAGHLGGAAIDVFPEANTPAKGSKVFSSPLQHLPNVILTPQYGKNFEMTISATDYRIRDPCRERDHSLNCPVH